MLALTVAVILSYGILNRSSSQEMASTATTAPVPVRTRTLPDRASVQDTLQGTQVREREKEVFAPPEDAVHGSLQSATNTPVVGQRLVFPDLKTNATLFLARNDRDLILDRIQALDELLGRENNDGLYAICTFEDARQAPANQAKCERIFGELLRSFSSDRVEAIESRKKDLCTDVKFFRARLGDFVDVAEKQLQEEPRLPSDLIRMARGIGLLELLCQP